MNNSLLQFDNLISEKSLLTHYFYAQKWSKGELTLDELRTYALEYFHVTKLVPRIVTHVRDRAAERRPDLLPFIERNLSDETRHIELWKRFSKSLGISEAKLEAHKPNVQVQTAIETLESLAEGSFEDGVATMYALELDLPQISKTKKEGLCEFYGLDTEDAHVYFDDHLEEEHHFNVWRKIEIDPERATPVIEKSLAAQHMVLDGVCEECGMCATC